MRQHKHGVPQRSRPFAREVARVCWAGTHLMGVKKLPTLGTMRFRRLWRGSVRCSMIQRSTFCITCATEKPRPRGRLT